MHLANYFVRVLATLLGVGGVYWLDRRRPPRWVFALIGIGVLLFLIECVRQAQPGGERFSDFIDAYYPAGVAAAHGDAAALSAARGHGVFGFVNLPIVAYLFAPFGLLGPDAAALVFTALGVGLSVASWLLLVRLAGLQARERWLLAFLFIADGPLLNSLMLGNTSQVVLLSLIGGLALIRSNRSAAGALLAATAVLKPPLMLFGLFFLLRRDVRGLAGFVVTGAAIAAASLAVFGWDANLQWFETRVAPFGHDWVPAINMQSIYAFVSRLSLGPAVLSTWQAYPSTPAERILADILTGIVFLSAGLAAMPRPAAATSERQIGSRLELQYMLVICVALVTSPLSWYHYYAWLLLPTAFFLRSQASLPPLARWLGWTAIVLTALPFLWLSPSNPLLVRLYMSVVVSQCLFCGLIWCGLISWWLAESGGWLRGPRTLPIEASEAVA